MKNAKNLPVIIQVVYGIGVSYAIVDQIFAQWVLTYYLPPSNFNMPSLLPPVLLSFALVFSRFIDMIMDPLVGYFSDRFNSKWGRRIPFMAVGAVPLVLSTIAFFYPPLEGSDSGVFMYLAVTGSLFFIFYTIVGAPYNALIPEISHNKSERLNLATWQSVFRLVYTALAMILPGILIKVFGQGDQQKGIRGMVILLSVFAFLGILITVLSVNERKYSGGGFSSESMGGALKLIFRNKSFLAYLTGFLFFFLGFNILRACMNYFVVDIMGKDETAITIASALLFGASAVCFYPVNLISRKFGYKIPVLISLLLLASTSFLFFFLGKAIPSDFGYLLFAFVGVPVSGAAFIFPPAMLSEIAAVEKKKSGAGVEGLFFGIQGFFLKTAFLLSIAIIPLVLVSGTGSGIIESLISKPDSISRSGIYLTSIISGVCFILSFVFYLFFNEEDSE